MNEYNIILLYYSFLLLLFLFYTIQEKKRNIQYNKKKHPTSRVVWTALLTNKYIYAAAVPLVETQYYCTVCSFPFTILPNHVSFLPHFTQNFNLGAPP